MKTTSEITRNKRTPRPPFGFALKFNPQKPPPTHKVFRADLPAFGFAWCDTHLARLLSAGRFPPATYLSARKRFWTYETLQAYEAVVTAGLDWRKWTAANLPLSEVTNWVTAKTAKAAVVTTVKAKKPARRKDYGWLHTRANSAKTSTAFVGLCVGYTRNEPGRNSRQSAPPCGTGL